MDERMNGRRRRRNVLLSYGSLESNSVSLLVDCSERGSCLYIVFVNSM